MIHRKSKFSGDAGEGEYHTAGSINVWMHETGSTN